VAHSHSMYGKAFSALGRNLDMITQDACAFYNDIVLHESTGVVLDDEEGNRIAETLSAKKAAILQNHGILTCGRSIESTVFWYTALEHCCQSQLLADAAATGRRGETVKIAEEDAMYTNRTNGAELAGRFQSRPDFEEAEYYFNRV
jgi:ribulose-5-phosphate 4-epimerase/fuculose-1-phosphate aldolase